MPLSNLRRTGLMRNHKIVLWQGTLAFCTVCKGGEGELTTECCGRPMTEEERNRVYKVGDLDFINGKWLNESNRNKRKSR